MFKVKSKLMRQGLVVIILPLVLEVVFMCLLAYFLIMAQFEIEEKIQSKKIVATATSIVARVIDSQLISMMYNAQKIPLLDVRFNKDKELSLQATAELQSLCADSQPRVELAEQIAQSVEATYRRLGRVFKEEVEDNAPLSSFTSTAAQTQKTYAQMTQVFSTTDRLLAREQQLQSELQGRERYFKNNVREAIIWGVILNVLVTIILAIYFAKNITRRLAVVLKNTERLQSRQPLDKAIGGDDELSHLDSVFHATADDLTEVDRQRKHLVSLVKEELSEPLRQVQYSLHNLSHGVYGKLSEKAETRLTLAARDTDRIVRLIDDLLSIETMEGGAFDLNVQQTSSSELIESAIGSIKDMADRYDVRIEVLDPVVTFSADKDRVIQVIINFLSNAIKFSPKQAKIRVEVIRSEQVVEFRIIDQGRGIPKDKLEQIFEPFQQVETKDQTDRGGTGLGLPISKTIVEQHGGTIGVESRLGEGSTFWFCIPLQ
ncbi:MAG: HAMP domain-containing histidine kinase [Candidatus Obscuribacterales bacterium]|nr:HAMP domain-containing histidine kinase [Candidatus Obscuribacterales bacterium]